MAIEVGMTGEVEQVVTQDLTADALGNKGVMVYATPYVIGLMETAAQAAYLQRLGCDCGQGFLFARPLDAASVLSILNAGPLGCPLDAAAV